jgi:outer membrane protein
VLRAVLIQRLAMCGAVISFCPSPSLAETLTDAIALAYQTNPALRAQRAELRTIDEGYVQARAGYGPQVNISAQVGYDDARIDQPAGLFAPASTAGYRAATGSVDLSTVQPVYTAGATTASVRVATANILAARQGLRQAESQLLQNVVTAYVDVRQDRASITILKDEVAALTREFAEIKAKGELGGLSKTDVAQCEARLLSAQAQLNLTIGRLNAANAEYLNFVGQSPGELAPEPGLAGLPTTADEAFDAADRNNPQLQQSIQAERAAREAVNQAKAANGPTVSIKLDAQVQPYEPYLQHQYDRNVTVAAVISKPLFTSGLNNSKGRQTLEEDNRAELQIEATRRGLVQQIAQAWDEWVSTRGAVAIEQKQVAAETVALGGYRVEERAGLRSTIDLLNAELELANTRLSLVQSRHDAYVAQASLLSGMGLLEARFLAPETAIINPQTAFKQIEQRGAPPWESAVAAIDSLGAPSSAQPRLSAPSAGAQRPMATPSLGATDR